MASKNIPSINTNDNLSGCSSISSIQKTVSTIYEFDHKAKVEQIKEEICIKYESNNTLNNSDPLESLCTYIKTEDEQDVQPDNDSGYLYEHVEIEENYTKRETEEESKLDDLNVQESELDPLCADNEIHHLKKTKESNETTDSSADYNKAIHQQESLNAVAHTNTEKKPFKCDMCDRSFILRSSLRRHARIHTGEKPFICKICGEAFHDRTKCVRHRWRHGEKSYKCEVCTKVFYDQSTLKKHVRLHTAEKCFNCEVCGKAFNNKSNMQRHLRIHTGERPFKCSVCGEDFNDKTLLKRHIRFHVGDQPKVS